MCMCMYVYVCMFVNVCVCVCVCVYIYIYTYIHAYACIYLCLAFFTVLFFFCLCVGVFTALVFCYLVCSSTYLTVWCFIQVVTVLHYLVHVYTHAYACVYACPYLLAVSPPCLFTLVLVLFFGAALCVYTYIDINICMEIYIYICDRHIWKCNSATAQHSTVQKATKDAAEPSKR